MKFFATGMILRSRLNLKDKTKNMSLKYEFDKGCHKCKGRIRMFY